MIKSVYEIIKILILITYIYNIILVWSLNNEYIVYTIIT